MTSDMNMDMDLDIASNYEEYLDEDLENSNDQDTYFDTVIGHIEDIVMDDNFQGMQNHFMEKYYTEFEDSEENKFVYSDIHKEYCDIIETYIQSELEKRIETFAMEEFFTELENRRDELDGEIFEMLLTFNDFVLFKEMFLDFKKAKEGDGIDLSMGINIRNLSDQNGTFTDFAFNSSQ